MINKETKIYCSFSSNPGNNGCVFFNGKFQELNINAIYKSFYSDDIKKSIEAVKSLDIKGFALSMPFKIEALDYVDEVEDSARKIGSINTVVNKGGYLKIPDIVQNIHAYLPLNSLPLLLSTRCLQNRYNQVQDLF